MLSSPQSITQPTDAKPAHVPLWEAQYYLDDMARAAGRVSNPAPAGGSAVTRGLRGDLDGPSGRHTLAGLARPNPCVAPAAGVRNGEYCEAVGASGTPVKGSGDPHSSGNEAVLPQAVPLGLSLPHISPRENHPTPNVVRAELQIAMGGSFAKLKYTGQPAPDVGGKKRGTIEGYSKESRGRLLDYFNRLDRRPLCRPLFIGLTYPGKWEPSPRKWKLQLQALWKRIQRKFGEFPGFWKLEFQERGAPHFHMLLFYPGRIPWEWLSAAWNDIVAPGDSDHLAAWGRIERADTWNGVISYVAMYLGKHVAAEDCPEGTGRLWGVWNKGLLRIEEVTYDMTLQCSWKVRRVMRAIQRKKGYKARVRSKFSGTKLYIVEREAKRLIAMLEPERAIPPRVYDAPLFPEGVGPCPEWREHIEPWWERKQRTKRTFQEIVASIKLKWERRE